MLTFQLILKWKITHSDVLVKKHEGDQEVSIDWSFNICPVVGKTTTLSPFELWQSVGL